MTPDKPLLRDEVQRKIGEIKRADILVGIPSYNNARTIPHVVRAVTGGLAKYFREYDAVLVNSDGGSEDGTKVAVENAELGATRAILVNSEVRQPHRLITAYQGVPGKGSAFRTIFEIAFAHVDRSAAVEHDAKDYETQLSQLPDLSDQIREPDDRDSDD